MPIEATDIEKKSLEAHVELCAERYNALEHKLETLDSKIAAVATMVSEVKSALTNLAETRNTQIMGWSQLLIVGMAGVIGYLLAHYVFK